MTATSPQPVSFDYVTAFSPEAARLARKLAEDPAGVAHDVELNEAFLAAAEAIRLGAPFTFAEQYDGAMVQDVRPADGREAERSSRGRAALDIHTDDSFLDPTARPEYLAFLGVANIGQVPTFVVRADAVVEQLDQETVDGLSEPRFRFGCPPSFEIPGGDERVPARPVLHRSDGGLLEVSFATRTSTAAPDDGEADRHLRQFRAALEATPTRDVVLEPGEILFVSNSRCLHGRPPVPERRWLKRLYLRRDLGVLERHAATPRPNVYTATAVIATAS